MPKEVQNNTDKYPGVEVMGKKTKTSRGTSPKEESFDKKGGQSK